MSLSARDRRALDSIRDRLSGSDPGLAGLLGTFTRLTAGEEMPTREQIRARWSSGGTRRRPQHGRSCRRGPRHQGFGGLGLGGALTLVWLLVTATLISVAIVLSTGSPGVPCRTSWALGCAEPTPGASLHSGNP